MKNFRSLLIICGLLLTLNLFSDNKTEADSLFTVANQAYEKLDYNKALDDYKKIIQLGYNSAELQNNIGNSAYKLKLISESILAYERALMLNPSNKEFKRNLEFANALTSDKIAQIPTNIFSKSLKWILDLLSYNVWAILSIFFSFLTFSAALVFLFISNNSIRKVGFFTSLVSFVVTLMLIFITTESVPKNRKNYAIITNFSAYAKSAPSNVSEDSFILHEGTKVEILDENKNWSKIKLGDGKIAWLENSSIEKI